MLNEQIPQTGPIEKSQITKTKTGYMAYDDAAALTLINDDTNVCDNDVVLNAFSGGWVQADQLWQSPLNNASYGSSALNADDIPRFLLSTVVTSIVPKCIGSIFYESPPFLLRPRPKTTPAIMRAKTALITYQLDAEKYEEEVEMGFDQCALLGTGMFKWGWKECERIEKKYVRKADPVPLKSPFGEQKVETVESDEFTIEYETKKTYTPWLKWVDLRHCLVDTSTRIGDARRAKFIIHRDYINWDYLQRLRETPGYTVPSDEDLKLLFFPPTKDAAEPDNQSVTLTENLRAWIQHASPRNLDSTSDPLESPIEILERWDNDKVIVAIRHGSAAILLRNEENPYHKIPFYSFNWVNNPDCFYGQGLGKRVGNDQRLEQAALNAALKIMRYSTKPMVVRNSGMNVPTQAIRQQLMGIIDVNGDVDKAYKILELPKVPTEVWGVISNAQASAASTSGANEMFSQGGSITGTRSTGSRTATGAAGVIAANASRLDGPVGRFIRQVMEPWLRQMDELNCDLLPTGELKRILNDEMAEDYKVDHLAFRSGNVDFEVLAGAKMGPKKEMTQYMPFLMQLFNNPPFVQSLVDAGYMFDANKIIKQFNDLAGFKYTNDFVVKMDAPTAARHQANMPSAIAAQKAQADKQLQDEKFAHERTMQEEEQLGKSTGEVVRSTIEHTMSSEQQPTVPLGNL